MAKDPAVLFYFNDWHGGTSTMSRHLKGCYLDLLYAQFNNGPLSYEEIKTVLNIDFERSWPTLQKKFKQDQNGLFFNERLLFEASKRKNYSESRSKNRTSKPDVSQHMSSHMENGNEDENRIINENNKSEEFSQTWIRWKLYRVEIKKPYKSDKSATLQLLELLKFEEPIAIAMINQSIKNGWQGIFELKNNENKQNTISGQTFKPGGAGKL